ncbi:MAG: hypothetical protein ABXS92_02285 [Sulfurimonas sp.]
MTINLFQTSEYRNIMEEHLIQTIHYLFEQNQEFAIACQVNHLSFSPELPEAIKETFKDTVLFVLSGYTYQSAKIEEKTFMFEAGFGNENFGSLVSVPLLAIKQLFVGETPVIINLADLPFQPDNAQKDSMEALLSNPKNKMLLKKKR